MQELVGNMVHNQRAWFADLGDQCRCSKERCAGIADDGLTNITARPYLLDLSYVEQEYEVECSVRFADEVVPCVAAPHRWRGSVHGPLSNLTSLSQYSIISEIVWI